MKKIENSQRTVIEIVEEEICSICLERVEKEHRLETPCHHIFHSNCLILWNQTTLPGQVSIQQTNYQTCPNCRQPILNRNPSVSIPIVSVQAPLPSSSIHIHYYHDSNDCSCYGCLLIAGMCTFFVYLFYLVLTTFITISNKNS